MSFIYNRETETILRVAGGAQVATVNDQQSTAGTHALGYQFAAAPDLLAASERALELLRSITDLPSDLAPFRESAARALADAIDKATGGGK